MLIVSRCVYWGVLLLVVLSGVNKWKCLCFVDEVLGV